MADEEIAESEAELIQTDTGSKTGPTGRDQPSGKGFGAYLAGKRLLFGI